ncbi:ABC transporter ATP-binding protein [Niallia sp. JL1B1071]|uniref:ABC transporter ATP-binding protein n=1 Tax=Niallia tiangongensis TaxID=3237105 RepID=UPI0037DC90BE
MLEIKNVDVFYDKNQSEVLIDINLQIKTGEIYAIIGPSGCGKSTLLKAISGLTPYSKGEILLNKKKISAKHHTIGLIPQNYGLLTWKTVFDNILLPLNIKGRQIDKTTLTNIDEIMEKLEIRLLKDQFPNKLSGGQKQRVAIARAFVLQPDILLMDEPFSALDALTRENIQELFLKIWKEQNITTLLITHSVEEAIYLGTKIVIMSPSPGRIITILDNPVHKIENKRTSLEHLQIATNIRNIMTKEWKK